MIDGVLREALERLVQQADGSGDVQRTVADLYDAAGCPTDAERHRSAPAAPDGVRDGHLHESERLRREGHELARAIADGTSDKTAADVSALWVASEHHRTAARSHAPVDALDLLRVAVIQLGHIPDLVAPADPTTGASTSIAATSDLCGFFTTRCRERFRAAAAAGDDSAAARALDAWVAFHRSYAIGSQLRSGSQFITVPFGILNELSELAAVAFVTGPQCSQSAFGAVEELVTGERGYVTRQLTPPQTWSAAITRVAAAHRDRGGPDWWRTEAFARRCAETALGCCDWQRLSWWSNHHRLLDLRLAPPGAAIDNYTGGFGAVHAALTAGLDDSQVISFVVSRNNPASSGVCVWPPEGSEELRGPLPAPPITAAAQTVAELLGVPARSVFDQGGDDFGPAPLLPGFGFAAQSLPNLDYWDQHAARLGTSVALVAGTLSAAGTQLLVCLADPVAVDFVHVPGLAVGSYVPDDDE